MLTFLLSISKPVTQNFCSLKRRTRGRPTYPSPITPMRAVRSSSLAARQAVGEEARYSKELICLLLRALDMPNSRHAAAGIGMRKPFRMLGIVKSEVERSGRDVPG